MALMTGDEKGYDKLGDGGNVDFYGLIHSAPTKEIEERIRTRLEHNGSDMYYEFLEWEKEFFQELMIHIKSELEYLLTFDSIVNKLSKHDKYYFRRNEEEKEFYNEIYNLLKSNKNPNAEYWAKYDISNNLIIFKKRFYDYNRLIDYLYELLEV